MPSCKRSSVFEGFLHPRTPPVPFVCIPLQCPDGSYGEVSLYSDGEEPHLVCTEGDHPVKSRAWTLEEKVLSRWILVYSSTHLRWLCDSGQYGDGGANFIDYMPAKYRLPYRGRAPLNVAAEEGHSEVVEKVVAYNAYQSFHPLDELSSLYKAIMKKYRDM